VKSGPDVFADALVPGTHPFPERTRFQNVPFPERTHSPAGAFAGFFPRCNFIRPRTAPAAPPVTGRNLLDIPYICRMGSGREGSRKRSYSYCDLDDRVMQSPWRFKDHFD
jgi:hypothetical protein